MGLLFVRMAAAFVVGMGLGGFLARLDRARDAALRVDRTRRRVAAAALRAHVRRDVSRRLARRRAESGDSDPALAWLRREYYPASERRAGAEVGMTPEDAA